MGGSGWAGGGVGEWAEGRGECRQRVAACGVCQLCGVRMRRPPAINRSCLPSVEEVRGDCLRTRRDCLRTRRDCLRTRQTLFAHTADTVCAHAGN